MANATSNTLKREGVLKGDVVALIMPNCMEYVAFWLGGAKIGAISALVNTGSIGDSLLHSLQVSRTKQGLEIYFSRMHF